MVEWMKEYHHRIALESGNTNIHVYQLFLPNNNDNNNDDMAFVYGD